MTKVGFIGLGTMGASFATNLIKAGFDLTVHDINRGSAESHLAAGATWADSPKALAEVSDVVLTSLPGPAEIEAVALDETNGLIAGMAAGAAFFDLSTTSPTSIRHVHAVMAEKGLHVLDAPVSGGPAGAASGKLAIWVGGDEAVFDKYRDVLNAMGDQARYIGPIGAGSIAKLVHNATGYAIQCAVGEMFAVGVKAGVEPLALWEAIRQGARGRQRTYDSLSEQYLINRYEPPAFKLKLAHKDVSLAAELGRDVGVPLRLINATLAEMTEGMGRGWQDLDSRAFLRLQQERAGIEIEVERQAVQAVFANDNK
ncbi:MAG: NAD-binding protein [Rhodospirillaceae bacterium]|jgi:3-hydroxyisobutyrate dehydrogenase-like beta-hydroxyacid dehydrogenase|nr:NAD-binding protein [Rhodospirillaceae bacterium]MBT6138774.1 NAD-binding protein [Rhodospirillaceae bacterium]